jgi:predicted transcriptional regulator
MKTKIKPITVKPVNEKEILKALKKGQQEEMDLAIALNYSLSALQSTLYQLEKKTLVTYSEFSNWDEQHGLIYLTYWELS